MANQGSEQRIVTAGLVVLAMAFPVVAADEPTESPAPSRDTPAVVDARPESAESIYDVEYRDAVDASAPHDPKAAQRLQQAESLLAEGRWERAQEVLLFTLDRAAGAMVLRRDGRLAPVADEANRLLGRLPTEVLELYRRQYGPAAEKALAEADLSGRRDVIERVATQFRHTPAGREALRRLAAIHFDRGEFGLAALRYQELAKGGLAPPLRLRAAYAWASAGNIAAAKGLLADTTTEERQSIAALLPAGTTASVLIAAATERARTPTVVDEWAMPFGDATASAVGQGGEPVLLRRWSRPLTYRAPIREEIDRTELELRDAGRVTIPAAVPLAVGDRVIARTLRGVAVYSASDGRLLWETDDGSSPERLLADGPGQFAGLERRQAFPFQFGPDPSGVGAIDQKPLASLLYRDGVYGLISSDGQRLFVIEDHASLGVTGMPLGWNDDADGRSGASSNRLVVYDLATGRLAWGRFGGLGGLVSGGAFESPLAGYHFFGPPTPADGTLYVVGEKEKEIRLIALDPVSGAVRWERPIANTQAGIDQDPVRRAWPAQVSVAAGVLVCPTTAGWLVGVDQSSRSILWAHRYAPPESGRDPAENNPAASPAALNSRWCPGAPILHRGRVIFAPSEEPRLVCLDLSTGELVWQRGKGANLYVAGVAGDLVVTVGSGAVEALDVASGAVRWSLPIPEEDGDTSGRAALTVDRLFLPVRGESLWQIDVATGELVGQVRLPPGEARLGNLRMYRGTLLSSSVDGITAFEERTALVRRVEDRLKADPDEPQALLRTAELRHAEGDAAAAEDVLGGIEPERLSDDLKDRFRRLRWDVLSSLARSEGAAGRDRLRTLAGIAQTDDEVFAVRRLEADLALEAGEVGRAAEAYLSFLEGSDGDRIVSEDDGRRSARLDAWLSGRFEDLRSSADEASRTRLDDMIRNTLGGAPKSDRERLATVFAFHPDAGKLALELADEEIAAGRLAEAETRLLPLTRREDGPIAAAALLSLNDLARRLDLHADAEHWLEAARRLGPDILLPGGETLASRLAADRGRTEMPLDLWGDFRLTVVRAAGYTSAESSIDFQPEQAALPFFRDRRMRLAPQPERLTVSGRGGAGLDQLIPLRSAARGGARPVVLADGHLLFVLYHDVLQAVSPAEGLVLWSMPLPDDAGPGLSSETTPQPMRPAGGLAGSYGLIARSRSRDEMPAASASYVAVRGRGELSVLDAATGAFRWSRNDIPRGAAVVGTENLLYVLPRDGGRRMILRASDGRAMELRGAAGKVSDAVAMVGDRLLTVVAEEPPFRLFDLPIGRRSVVTLYDPHAGEAVWKRTYPADALFSTTYDGQLCVLEPDGRLTTIEAATGKPSPLGDVPEELLRGRSEAYLLTDALNAYVIVNNGQVPAFFAAELPAIPVKGEVFAFEREDGRLLWRREVSNRRLICQEFDHLPVLLFTDTERTEKGNQAIWRVDLLALDKRTGEPVLDEPYHTTSTPFFRGLTVRPDRRSIELGAYHARLRLQAIPKSAADGTIAAPSPPDE